MTRKPQARDPYASSDIAVRIIWASFRFILFGVVVVVLAMALFITWTRWNGARQGGRVTLEAGDPSLSATERLFLQGYLSINRERLQQPIGFGRDPVEFEVKPGQNANQIAINLAAAGVLLPDNESLFLNYLRFYGLDSQLEAGRFVLTPAMDMQALAETLINAAGDDTTLTFIEGWRSEEMANYLAVVQPANIDASTFMALVNRSESIDTSPYPYIGDQRSLEGFLFPDTYRIGQDATAADLIALMLSTFDARVTPALRDGFRAQGLDVAQAASLAAIVEREAVVDAERPLIASVFLNRLQNGIKLDADPTVQYAVGYDAAGDSWWKSPLTVDDLQFDSPYNTYLYPGLPPSPIANASLGALEAVAAPAVSDYLFFVANCTGQAVGTHLFSVTYEEHLEKVNRCR